MHTYIHYIHTYIHTYIVTYIHNIYTYIHTYTHKYIHTFTHTYLHPLSLVMNPAYYGLLDPSPEGIESHLSQLIVSVLEELQAHTHTYIHTYIHTYTYHALLTYINSMFFSYGHAEKWLHRDGPADRDAGRTQVEIQVCMYVCTVYV